eukprot:TRINITY_DN1413_c3_g1_i1.p1 TRINITY_DN1413_c3_g1~~TRINITY_DN1413_c3_g1_i1.p1  ORF type:complete len:386 (+),score=80.86 TRINITY_DN1413_c3_g1_i1:146-1303(+)
MANLAQVPGGLAKFVSNFGKYRSVGAQYKKALNAGSQYEYGYSYYYQTHVPCEVQGVIPISGLQIKREDFTHYAETAQDVDRMVAPTAWTLLTGGLPIFALPFWANATHKLPACFFDGSEESYKTWGKIKDQEVAIKHAGVANNTHMRYLEYFISGEPKFNEAFDSIADGFTAAKDPQAIREMGHFIHEMRTCSIPLITAHASSWLRGREHMEAAAFLGKPFLFMNVKTLNGRLVDHYRILFQEDVLIQENGGVESLNDFELYKICNRRHIARWEDELTRDQLIGRLNNWWALTAHEEGKHVPLRVILMYQTAHFKDPGFLDETLDSLDTDAFPTSMDYAKDAFVRRLEFENGPLEEQVRAHVKLLQQREEELKNERTKFLAKEA